MSLLCTWPSGKLPFECQKIAQNFFFNCQWQKNKTNFGNFFEKKSFWQFFDSQMSIFRRVRLEWLVYRNILFGVQPRSLTSQPLQRPNVGYKQQNDGTLYLKWETLVLRLTPLYPLYRAWRHHFLRSIISACILNVSKHFVCRVER